MDTVTQRKAFVLRAVSGGFLFLGACFLIDLFFIDYTFLTPYSGLPAVSPLYGFFIPTFSKRIFLVLLAGLAFFCYLVVSGRVSFKWNLFLFFLFAVIVRADSAYIRHDFDRMGMELMVYPGEETLFDAFRIYKTGLGTYLKNYPSLMPELSLHGKHYPPGYSVFQYGIIRLISTSVNVIGWILLIFSSAAVVPLMLTARQILKRDEGALIAGSLFVMMPSGVIYGAVSLSALFATVTMWTVYLLVRGLATKKKSLQFAGGILLGVCMLLNFSVFPLGLFVLLFYLACSMTIPRDYLAYCLLLILAGFLFLLIVVYGITGLNMYACFFQAYAENSKFLSGITGKNLHEIYLHSTWGNLLAFFIGIGFPVFGLWIADLKRNGIQIRFFGLEESFSLALLVAILFTSSTGFYFMKTERCWLFWGYLALIPTAKGLQKTSFTIYLATLILIFFQTLLQESLLFTIW